MDINIFKVFLAKPFLAAIIAQASSQIFKIFLPVFQGKPPDIKKIADYGDIPSAHTAFIVAVTIEIGLQNGWASSIFSLAAVVASILIYDIIKLRKTVEINLKMSKQLMELNKLPLEKNMPQFKAHTLLEVVVGGIWGTVCAVIIFIL